jgi:hypothetical protein
MRRRRRGWLCCRARALLLGKQRAGEEQERIPLGPCPFGKLRRTVFEEHHKPESEGSEQCQSEDENEK